MLASAAILLAAAALSGPTEITCHPPTEFRAIAVSHGHAPTILAMGSLHHPRVWLRSGTCRVLTELGEGKHRGWHSWAKVARHTLILGHELAHNQGLTHENEDAECWGVARSKRLARVLGHPRPYRVREWASWWSTCPAESQSK